MPIFSHPDFDDHELVVFHRDPVSGLKAIIAVHNTHLGRGLGGCRVYPYAHERDALTDVLRLSRGMTYKAALAGLKQGGGKSVVIGDPRHCKTPEAMRAMGRFVDSLGGRYVIAEDSGTDLADMQHIAIETSFIGGIADGENLRSQGGRDTSEATAYGVLVGIQAAVRFKLGGKRLADVRVAIQGLGKVGMALARLLSDAGAKLWVHDRDPALVNTAVDTLGATPVGEDALFRLDVDVFAPCALGAVLNDQTIPALRAQVIAGAANNQLAEPRHGRMLLEHGLLYAPDYVINAAGIINIYYEGEFYRWPTVESHIREIGTTLGRIFERSAAENRPTGEVADRMAETIFRAA
ncbi:MAG: Glu/Leu/Phe/Val family dehydrogenase [Panacagrimonas sp.]